MAVALAVCLPMIATRQSYFNDWQNHLYLVAKQASYVKAHVAPAFFLNSADRGWFYPFYAFYGGTLYYAVALLAVALGSAWVAYVASYFAAVVASFYGWTWVAKQAGLQSGLRYVPGIVYGSGAYYLTNVYGRGAWPEFVGTSMIPLVLAAMWNATTAQVLTPPVIVILVLSVAFLTGSHTITLIFSIPFLAAAFCATMLVWTRSARTSGRWWRPCGLAAIGVGVNAWFLAPLLAYRETLTVQPGGTLGYRDFDRLEVIFSLVRVNPYAESTPQLYVQAPVFPLVAAVITLLSGAICLRSARLLGLSAVVQAGFAMTLWLLTAENETWNRLPAELRIIQFPYRLNGYLLACISGLALVACLYADRLRSRGSMAGLMMTRTLVAAMVLQFVQGQYQIWTSRTYGDADSVTSRLDMLPPTFYDRAYFNRTAPQIALASDDEIGGVAESLDALEVEIPWRARRTGRLLRTNIVYSPLVEFEPPRVVGQSGGYVVLDVEGLTPSTRIVAKWARTPTIVAGAVVSVISVLALAAVVGRVAVRQVGGARTRRARDGRHTLRRGDP